MSRAWTLLLGIVCVLFAALAPRAAAAEDPQPDLAVKKLAATYEASPVRQLLIAAKIANAGDDMDGKGKLTVTFSGPDGKVAQAKAAVPAIEGGKKRSLSLNLGVPDDVGGRVYDLEACVKPPKGARDAAKANNCKTISPVEIPKAPSEPSPKPEPGPSPDPTPNPEPGPLPDTTPPETAITSGPAEGAEDRNFEVVFAFASSEGGSSFECRVDAGSFQPCTSPESVFVTFDGPRTFAVRATDAAGNVDPTPATRTWIANTVIELSSFELDQSCVYNDGTHSNARLGTVTLDRPAEGDTVVSMASSSPSVIVSNATIQSGQTSAPVLGSVTAPGSTTLTAQRGSGPTQIQRILEVRPIGSALAIESLTLNPTSVVAGAQSIATVRLDCIAPAGGTVVSLGDNDGSITVPSSRTVSQGAREVIAEVQTSVTTTPGTYEIYANLGGPPTSVAFLDVTAP